LFINPFIFHWVIFKGIYLNKKKKEGTGGAFRDLLPFEIQSQKGFLLA